MANVGEGKGLCWGTTKEVLGLSLCALALTGCSSDLEARLAAAEAALTDQKGQIEILQQESAVSKWKFRGIDEHVKVHPDYSTAEFDPAAQEGFQRIDTSMGSVIVRVESVSAAADGSAVDLSIGNLLAADLTGITLSATWGVRMPPGAEGSDFLDWYGGLAEKKISIDAPLKSGFWNVVKIKLPGMPPSQLGYLRLGVDGSGASLRTR